MPPRLPAAAARRDLRLRGVQRFLHRIADIPVRGRRMDIRSRHPEIHRGAEARARFPFVVQPHHRLFEARAGRQGEQPLLDQPLDRGPGPEAAVLEENLHHATLPRFSDFD